MAATNDVGLRGTRFIGDFFRVRADSGPRLLSSGVVWCGPLLIDCRLVSSVAGSFADFLLTQLPDSWAGSCGGRYAAVVNRHLPPTWRKPALVGLLTSVSCVTATLLAGHEMTALVLVNGATNGVLAVAALTPAAQILKKVLPGHSGVPVKTCFLRYFMPLSCAHPSG